MAQNRDKHNQNPGRGGGQGGAGQGRGNPASNIPREGKVKGGQHSAQQQTRDDTGQFSGKNAQARRRDNE